MNTGSCSHVENYKIKDGFSPYSLLHSNFITCLKEGSRERKAKLAYCHDCHMRRGRVHACLSCIYFGCFNNDHINRHSQDSGHIISVDLKFGNIYCHKCNDYQYDKDFERLSKKFKRKFGKMMGIEVYDSWEPTLEEVKLIKDNGGLKKVYNNSFIGLRGLINLGHTCFMNCIVQVLVHTPLLREYFLSDTHLCEMEDPKYCLVCEMFVTFQEFYSGNPIPHVPSRLVYLMWTHAKHLNGFQQQDAHEFFIAILDILHKQCQGEVPDETKRCNCVIDQIFKGFYQSDIVCQECNHVSTTYDPFLDISLNLGGGMNESENGVEQAVSLLDCISRYTQPENLSIQCTSCGSASRTKQLTLKMLPFVTCFHLKRLEHSLGSKKKNTTHVIFPECFDMSPYMSTNRGMQQNGPIEESKLENSDNKFCLFAVVNHKGDRDGGHYISYIRQQHDKWYQCDDSLVTSASVQDVFASEGYLLFYHKQIFKHGISSNFSRPKDPEMSK
ncbi:hypothetical protein JTE90_007273 [Oedothorax gibbosus]|uniref:ubiquitinyl hydrolase 1 n=1 Tax=Oedothorax gibbosus TaxID=931172 RepID=A0AAV6VNZ0_9ARAC|nr:hypothetical protein JTE90_007273 [Oedothorax gibbosus]